MHQISILIVEDEPIIARDLAISLQNIDYAVAGICYELEEAMAFLQTKSPDFIILDINLGQGEEGIQLGTFIDQKLKLPFIYLSSYSDEATLNKAKFTYPLAFLVKPFDEKELFTSIEIALFNHSKIHNRVHFTRQTLNQSLASPLTEKEFEVLLDLYSGLTNKQLCEKHFISINTVKTHVKRIFGKFDAQSRTDLLVKLRNWN